MSPFHDVQTRLCGVAAAFVLASCGTSVRDTSLFGSGGTASEEGPPPATEAMPGGTAEGSSEEEDTGIKLDVAAGTGGFDSGDGKIGCEKVDFLFVVDNSGSMADEQSQLVAAFPQFVATLQETLAANDYHLMVIDTDAVASTIWSDGTCMPHPDCCTGLCEAVAGAGSCNGEPCPPPTGDCDQTLGAGKVLGSAGEGCLPGPSRFMTSGDVALADLFGCVAEVGTNGSGHEVQVGAMLDALRTDSAAATCNEGFLRDDAVLVVTIITDEEDDPSDGGDPDPNTPGEPDAWFDEIVAIKHGDATAVVMLGLVGDTDLPGPVCSAFDPEAGQGAEGAPRLRALVEKFGNRGIWGSVCGHDYADFFAEAVGLIDTACDEFEPPG